MSRLVVQRHHLLSTVKPVVALSYTMCNVHVVRLYQTSEEGLCDNAVQTSDNSRSMLFTW